jgi:hypothetical protein
MLPAKQILFFIMGRFTHTEMTSSKSSNPSTRFMEWNSAKKTFTYYDKQLSERVDVKLPVKFVLINEYSKVGGWDSVSDSKIVSNEVENRNTQAITVKTFDKKDASGKVLSKSRVIASGMYNEIKDAVGKAGCDFYASIYVMLEDGSIANIALKKSALSSWINFNSLVGSRVNNQWIQVSKSIDKKTGAINYSVPEFEIGSVFKKEEMALVEGATQTLKAYMDEYFATSKKQEAVTPVEDAGDLELDF